MHRPLLADDHLLDRAVRKKGFWGIESITRPPGCGMLPKPQFPYLLLQFQSYEMARYPPRNLIHPGHHRRGHFAKTEQTGGSPHDHHAPNSSSGPMDRLFLI